MRIPVKAPPGGIQLIYKDKPRGCKVPQRGVLINQPPGDVMIDLFPVARCSFGQPGAIVASV